ncbi:MAG: thioredoxin [Kiritimatiellae bacterium]|nr:thioredoxin [Kiritimatiellia bacterium]
MAETSVIHIDADNWQSEVLDSLVPVLVDFWAEWCGPCRAIAPILDQVSVSMGGKIKIVKVDVDKLPQVAAQFGIRSIPTLLVMKDGQVQEQMVGAMNKADLETKLQGYL